MYFRTESKSYWHPAIYTDVHLGEVKRINGLVADAVKNGQPLITKLAAVLKQLWGLFWVKQSSQWRQICRQETGKLV